MEDNFINEKNIITLLCRKRVKLRQKNRQDNFINSISSINASPSNMELLNILPPRKYWPRPSKKMRIACIDYDSMYSKYLSFYVMRQYGDPSVNYTWKDNLKKFIENCKDKFDNIKSKKIAPERILPIPKNTSYKCKKFRIIATYSLEDSVFNSLIAKYLSDLIDCKLSNCCYSFRSSSNGVAKTHHDSVRDIMSVTHKISKNNPLWVAECDIKGFFDCISHNLITSKLELLSDCDCKILI